MTSFSIRFARCLISGITILVCYKLRTIPTCIVFWLLIWCFVRVTFPKRRYKKSGYFVCESYLKALADATRKKNAGKSMDKSAVLGVVLIVEESGRKNTLFILTEQICSRFECVCVCSNCASNKKKTENNIDTRVRSAQENVKVSCRFFLLVSSAAAFLYTRLAVPLHVLFNLNIFL